MGPASDALGSGSGATETGQDAVATGYLRSLPAQLLLGEGCSLVRLEDPWRLDPGWRAFGAQPLAADSVAPGSGLRVIAGAPGQTLVLPADSGGRAPDSPCLVLATGGVTLDARARGDVYGVIVVDDGDVLLDGTTVHGAVFATGTIAMGETGRVFFFRSILRWATDRSLSRVRLVPGTREEGME